MPAVSGSYAVAWKIITSIFDGVNESMFTSRHKDSRTTKEKR